MTDSAAARPSGDKPRSGQKPAWMSIPGGPKEPVWADFTSKVQKLNAEKTKLFDRVKELNAALGTRDDNNPAAVERRELQGRLNEIREKHQGERDVSKGKRDAIQQVRNDKAQIEAQLRTLTSELGMFQSLEEINKAIDIIQYRMETGAAGSLSGEKKTQSRLMKLENAKSLILKLQPLQEAIYVSEERENELHAEFKEVSERMKQLNVELSGVMDERKVLDSQNKKSSEDRQKIFDERRSVSDKISEVMTQINALRTEFDNDRKAWDEWRIVAQKKYTEKIEAEREERNRKWRERQEALRNERKKEKIAKRRNPYVKEIEVCTSLIQYLKDKSVMQQKSEEERKRRREAENFNPNEAPQGTVLLKPKFDEICLGVKKSKSKKDKEKAKAKEAAESATSAVVAEADNDRSVQHSQDKRRLFDIVGVEAPISINAFSAAIASIQAKQKEYESHIQTGNVDVSSSEDEAEEQTVAVEAAAE
eukprot:GILI01009816.1.p1 GENE.GILI01009816.1~~GILI01009816.1.p1  ORF type:complete len:479 (+),score=132.93 GILI01009816.1:28-1464(+)